MRSHVTCVRAGWRDRYRRCGWNGVSSAWRLRQNSVMPRCYPLVPGFGSGRTAERQVWEVLRDQLPADAALLHSVTMIERATEYEADLVVGWPGVGVAVIEVKGGHISRDQGQWYQSSGGETRPVKDPVAQAQDCRHVLLRLLAQYGSEAAAARFAHLVAASATPTIAGLLAQTPPSTSRTPSPGRQNAGK